MKRLHSALTLIEVLVVICVIAILAALLFPVLAKGKLAGQQSVCISNLKQAGVAMNLYLEDNGDYPIGEFEEDHRKKIRMTSPLTKYTKTATRVFLCPLDQPEGRLGLPANDRQEPLSYAETWILWEGESGVQAWKELLTLDTNPILFRCYFHTDHARADLMSRSRATFGITSLSPAQAVRLDGSVKTDKRLIFFTKHASPGEDGFDMKKMYWTASTEAPCPDKICDGKDPVEGTRQR
jgi:prepilin-type N-terminal cleavage/methylation domain-containing protein